MTRYSIEPNTRKYVIKWYGFLSFTKNASKKVVHKTAEATGRFLGN